MNRIKICCVSLLSSAMSFSCNSDPSDFANKAYINAGAPATTFFIDIEENELRYTSSLAVETAKRVEEDIAIRFSADPSLVATYNSFYSANAIELPAEYYEFDQTSATISAGSVRSTPVDIEFNNINELNDELIYVLPVTIADINMEVLESLRTHYFIFRRGALINWAADIEQNFLPVNWSNQALVANMPDLTIESMLYIRELTRDGSDSNIMTFFGVEDTFLIRLGDQFEPGQIMVVKSGTRYPDVPANRTTVPLNEWFHLAVTHSANNIISIYLNGELRSQSNVVPGVVSLLPASTTNICYIGRSWNTNRWWPGLICETRVWNVVRTPDEIANNMYRVDANSQGLVSYWKFNEGEERSIADYTGGTNLTANSALQWVSVSLPEE